MTTQFVMSKELMEFLMRQDSKRVHPMVRRFAQDAERRALDNQPDQEEV